MTHIDDVRAKMPCPLHTLFCIVNQINTDGIEPWYGQIKKLADGANKWASGMHEAVIFGMYPELEEASKEHYRKFEIIYNEFENNPDKDKKRLLESLKELSFQIGEKYGLNKNRYFFNEMTEEQAKRVQKRKDVEIKNMCNESAEAKVDSIHIIMQALCKKLSPEDCKKLMHDFTVADKTLKGDEVNDLKKVEFCRKSFPEAYSIYEQVKNNLKIAEIKDCYQIIDAKNYARFIQTLGNFKYNGKEYNLLDVVKPITQKRDIFGEITEIRPNTILPAQQINVL